MKVRLRQEAVRCAEARAALSTCNASVIHPGNNYFLKICSKNKPGRRKQKVNKLSSLGSELRGDLFSYFCMTTVNGRCSKMPRYLKRSKK